MALSAVVEQYLCHISIPTGASRAQQRALRKTVGLAIDLRTIFIEALAKSVGLSDGNVENFLADCRIRGMRECPFLIVVDSNGLIPTTVYFSSPMHTRIASRVDATQTRKPRRQQQRGSRGKR